MSQHSPPLSVFATGAAVAAGGQARSRESARSAKAREAGHASDYLDAGQSQTESSSGPARASSTGSTSSYGVRGGGSSNATGFIIPATSEGSSSGSPGSGLHIVGSGDQALVVHEDAGPVEELPPAYRHDQSI